MSHEACFPYKKSQISERAIYAMKKTFNQNKDVLNLEFRVSKRPLEASVERVGPQRHLKSYLRRDNDLCVKIILANFGMTSTDPFC